MPEKRSATKSTFKIFVANARAIPLLVLVDSAAIVPDERGAMRYHRDMRGYGANPPDPKWPGGAHVARAVRRSITRKAARTAILHGDEASEAFLSEIVGAAPWPGQRHWNMESIYEYGARAGFWRLHRMFTEAAGAGDLYGVATALARSPDQVAAMQEAGWEIASHGLKWIDYRDHAAGRRAPPHRRGDPAAHRGDRGASDRLVHRAAPRINTVRLVAEEGGFDYVSDTYDDDLPYWLDMTGTDAIAPQLIIPYTLDANDMRFATPQGFNSGDQFFAYLRDSFDTLYAEGEAGRPRMMNIGLHCRLVGRPGRVGGAEALHRLRQSRTTRSGWRGASTSPGTGSKLHPYAAAGAASLADGARAEFVDALRRHLRAFALDRRARLRARTRRRRTTAPAACTMRSAASSARRPRPSGSPCSTPIRTLPAGWPRPSG